VAGSALPSGQPRAHGHVVAGVARRPGHAGRRRVGAHERVRSLLRGQPAREAGVDRRALLPAARRPWTRSCSTSARTPSTPTGSGCSRPSSTSPPCAPPASSSGRTRRCGLVSPSGQAVQALLTFWRQTRDDGSPGAGTSPTPTCRPASSATSTRTCRTTRRRPSPCSRPRSSSRSSSSTRPWSPRCRAAARGLPDDRPHLRVRPLPARRLRPAQRPLGDGTPPGWSREPGCRRRWMPCTASTSTPSPSRSPGSGSSSRRCRPAKRPPSRTPPASPSTSPPVTRCCTAGHQLEIQLRGLRR
jgi:hypothetical protein